MVLEKDVRQFTKSRLLRLTNSQSEGDQKAQLANLRRGISKSPGDDPKLWGNFLCDMPEEMFGQTKEPSFAEWAVYIALTMFALHQQGRDIKQECMYVENRPFGNAMAGLVEQADNNIERVTQRFNVVATSTDMQELTYHLRGVVQLLRGKGIPVDYVDLAGDLFRFQFPEQKEYVRLKWGQDFYKAVNKQSHLKGEEINE